jgi:hypothetical protein
MGEKGFKRVGFYNVIEIVDGEVVFTYCEVVGVGTELDAVNGSHLVKFLYYFVHSVIYDVDSSLLTSRYDVVSFAG